MTIQDLLQQGELREEQLFPGARPVLTNAPPGRALCVVCGKWRGYWDFSNGLNGECEGCTRDQHGSACCAWCGGTFKLSASQHTRWRKSSPVHCSRAHARKAMHHDYR